MSDIARTAILKPIAKILNVRSSSSRPISNASVQQRSSSNIYWVNTDKANRLKSGTIIVPKSTSVSSAVKISIEINEGNQITNSDFAATLEQTETKQAIKKEIEFNLQRNTECFIVSAEIKQAECELEDKLKSALLAESRLLQLQDGLSEKQYEKLLITVDRKFIDVYGIETRIQALKAKKAELLSATLQNQAEAKPKVKKNLKVRFAGVDGKEAGELEKVEPKVHHILGRDVKKRIVCPNAIRNVMTRLKINSNTLTDQEVSEIVDILIHKAKGIRAYKNLDTIQTILASFKLALSEVQIRTFIRILVSNKLPTMQDEAQYHPKNNADEHLVDNSADPYSQQFDLQTGDA